MRFDQFICSIISALSFFIIMQSKPLLATDMDNLEPPRNEYLANSAWPMSHRNSYVQDSSPLPGPAAAGSAKMLTSKPVAISVVFSSEYADGTVVGWGNTLKEVFKIDATAGKWRYIAHKKRHQSVAKAISGAYSLVDLDGTFFVPRGTSIDAYRDEIVGDAFSGIVLGRSFQIPNSHLNDSDESIVGINMTYDGWIAFATNQSLVGVVSRDFKQAFYLRIAAGEELSNSIAVDEQGGIYPLTSKNMYRVNWDGNSLQLVWKTPYRSALKKAPGRLGAGSGTTPTLMGVGDQDRFVVIADGQNLMSLVLFWRDDIPADWEGLPGRDRRIAAEVPITFGNENRERSVTEQSAVVRGYGVMVVNNDYGDGLGLGLLNIFDKLKIFFSNERRVAPYGVEKFVWNPETRILEKAWANQVISCPNGIPTMSSATGLAYCVGQRQESWTLEGIDWFTGESRFHQTLGQSSDYNSFYAALEIGSAVDLVSGMFGGILQMK